MMPTSLRRRLPLTYAGIALLATLSLGVMLIATLLVYYGQREEDYLATNAWAVSNRLAHLVAEDAPPAVLKAQVEGFAFLLQTRVVLYDAAGQVVVDSGLPTGLFVDLAVQSPPAGADGASTAGDFDTSIVVRRQPLGAGVPFPALTMPGLPAAPDAPDLRGEAARQAEAAARLAEAEARQAEAEARRAAAPPAFPALPPLPVRNTLYGFSLSRDVDDAGLRSDRRIDALVVDLEHGRALGSVALSDGPPYGREIVLRVALTWLVASALASLLAAGAGWLVSRRLTAPLLALTAVTERMAEGDLATRARVERRDEIGRLARSFNAMAGRIEENVATLRRFVADAAHELNTPLTALRANLDLALEAGSVEERAGFVAQARADGQRLERLMNDLLDLSRIEAGPVATDQPLDLTAVLRTASERYAAQAEQAGLGFGVTLPAEAVMVRADEVQVRRALDNVVDNAVKFTPPGGRVGLRLADDDTWATVTVDDTGPGIPAEDQPHLFSRFHRGRNAAAYPGSGLGLAIVKAMMTRHGGDVTVTSSSSGTVVTLRWPRMEATF